MKISIPQPCHENWNEMLPAENGRFCQSCQKCVIDFTRLSDDEILKILKMPNQCGRFSTNQLEEINRKLKEENQIRFPRIFRYSTLMIGLGLGGTLVAQEKEKVEILQSKSENTNQKKSDSIFIKANIIDQYNFPVSDALVSLKNYSIKSKSDENGYFEMMIPNGDQKSILIINDPIGFSQEFCIADIKNEEIKLDYPDMEILSGTVGGIVLERSFTGKVLHTLSWPFRQIGKIF